VEGLKNNIKSFQQFLLNEYHHEKWTTQDEGDLICGFILALIDHVEKLEERMKTLEKKILIKAVKGFYVMNCDKSSVVAMVEADAIYEVYLDNESEEYFSKDKNGREFYVGELDFNGKLILEDGFVELTKKIDS
jgi:hypothetical protein